ncbi:MAG: diaminopimelate epimerase [Alphaproteobacteria bacterium]|nr:diaminopimelate epimerase [Alphaproteobacteria bacterium]
MDTAFVKMHGLGNDFIVFDARQRRIGLGAAQIRALADRHRGIGCDQVIVIEPAAQDLAMLRFFNADGGESGACGNGTRCVGAMLLDQTGSDHATLSTVAGRIAVDRSDGEVWVDMGPARLDWRDIPLSRPQDTLHLELRVDTEAGSLADPVAVSMGNPHAVFFVPDVEVFDLATIGPRLERHPLFPERANITLANVQGRERIVARVWERGAGLTLACGTAACAMAVAAVRRDLCDRRVKVVLPGGTLTIEWRADNHVLMSGAVSKVFQGSIDLDRLTARP